MLGLSPIEWIILVVLGAFGLNIVSPSQVLGWVQSVFGKGVPSPEATGDVELDDFRAYQRLLTRSKGRSAEAAAAVSALLVPLFGAEVPK